MGAARSGMIIIRFVLAVLAAALGLLATESAGNLVGTGHWWGRVSGALFVASLVYALGQFHQIMRDPYREPLPLEEPSVLNPGPLAMVLLAFGLMVLLVVAADEAYPQTFEVRRALGVIAGVGLIAMGRSKRSRVLEMNEAAPLARWIGMKAQQRLDVALGILAILFFLFAPGEWLTWLGEVFDRSRGRRRRTLERLWPSDSTG